ncbi:MAG TPA: hypothetical protein VLG38_01575 [Gammaproteobacteria bacterium]|nr:hypothetical protein [Gammaproteobacteria bacterium]
MSYADLYSDKKAEELVASLKEMLNSLRDKLDKGERSDGTECAHIAEIIKALSKKDKAKVKHLVNRGTNLLLLAKDLQDETKDPDVKSAMFKTQAFLIAHDAYLRYPSRGHGDDLEDHWLFVPLQPTKMIGVTRSSYGKEVQADNTDLIRLFAMIINRDAKQDVEKMLKKLLSSPNWKNMNDADKFNLRFLLRAHNYVELAKKYSRKLSFRREFIKLKEIALSTYLANDPRSAEIYSDLLARTSYGKYLPPMSLPSIPVPPLLYGRLNWMAPKKIHTETKPKKKDLNLMPNYEYWFDHDRQNLLTLALQAGNIALATELLARQADILTRNDLEDLLKTAVTNKRTAPILYMILDKYPNKTFSGDSLYTIAIVKAIEAGNMRVAEKLLEKYEKFSLSPQDMDKITIACLQEPSSAQVLSRVIMQFPKRPFKITLDMFDNGKDEARRLQLRDLLASLFVHDQQDLAKNETVKSLLKQMTDHYQEQIDNYQKPPDEYPKPISTKSPIIGHEIHGLAAENPVFLDKILSMLEELKDDKKYLASYAMIANLISGPLHQLFPAGFDLNDHDEMKELRDRIQSDAKLLAYAEIILKHCKWLKKESSDDPKVAPALEKIFSHLDVTVGYVNVKEFTILNGIISNLEKIVPPGSNEHHTRKYS